METTFDLDNYPNKTDQVLIAMHPDNIESEHMVKLSTVADKVELSKDNVRYRVNLLVEDGYITKLKASGHKGDGNIPNEYALNANIRPTVETLIQTKNVLGEIPTEATKEDIVKLVDHIQHLKKDTELIKEDIKSIKKTIRF